MICGGIVAVDAPVVTQGDVRRAQWTRDAAARHAAVARRDRLRRLSRRRSSGPSVSRPSIRVSARLELRGGKWSEPWSLLFIGADHGARGPSAGDRARRSRSPWAWFLYLVALRARDRVSSKWAIRPWPIASPGYVPFLGLFDPRSRGACPTCYRRWRCCQRVSCSRVSRATLVLVALAVARPGPHSASNLAQQRDALAARARRHRGRQFSRASRPRRGASKGGRGSGAAAPGSPPSGSHRAARTATTNSAWRSPPRAAAWRCGGRLIIPAPFEIDPLDGDAHDNLGAMLAREGRTDRGHRRVHRVAGARA